MIEEQHLPAMQGMFPSTFSTCSKDGEPNTTVISQVWYVDEEHVALSFQFFSKTRKNIAENPFGYVTITNPMTMDMYGLDIEFVQKGKQPGLIVKMVRREPNSFCSFNISSKVVNK